MADHLLFDGLFGLKSFIKFAGYCLAMETPMEGSNEELEPDDALIERCYGCDFCVFEKILRPKQRKRNVLNEPIPRGAHLHRQLIEDLCSRDMDDPCEMKYAAMRASITPFFAAQYGCVDNATWDLGKRSGDELHELYGKDIDPKRLSMTDGLEFWTMENDKGRGFSESYAERFREIWNLGLRPDGGPDTEKQILSTRDIYETVIASPETYETGLKLYTAKKEEAKQRCIYGIHH